MTSPTKPRKLKFKIFFRRKLEDSPSLLGFEQLSSTIDWQVMELQNLHGQNIPLRAKFTQLQRCPRGTSGILWTERSNFFCFDIVKLFCDRFWSNTHGASALIMLSPLTETSPAVSGVGGWGTAACVKVEQCFTRGHSVTFFGMTFALPSLCGMLVTVIIQRSSPSRHLYFRQMFA